MQLKGILSRNHHPLHHCLSLFADLGNVRTHVSSVKDALDSYNGGVWGLMSIANKLNSARNSICSARSELDSLEMMTGLDFEDWSEAYDELHSVMVDTLHSADGKVLSHLLQPWCGCSRRRTETVLSKMSKENGTTLDVPNDEVNQAFKLVYAAC